MATREEIITRVGVVTGYLLITLWALTAAALLGAAALAGAVFVVGGTDRSSVILAVLLGAVGVIAAVILGLFANDLRPVRRLPEITGTHVREATGTLATSLAAGERRFLQAKGLGRVTSLGRALWDVRKDVQSLGDGGLAPAVALFDVLVPTRLFQVAVCALAAPLILFVGLLALAFAAVLG